MADLIRLFHLVAWPTASAVRWAAQEEIPALLQFTAQCFKASQHALDQCIGQLDDL